MVEFAIVGPLFLLMTLGLVEISRAVFYYNVISNAAREGGREAILAYNQCSNISPGVAPCDGPPSGTSLAGVETAVKRAGGGALGFDFTNAERPTDSGTPTACAPADNRGCVFVFVNGGANATNCTDTAGLPDKGPGPTDNYSLCNFNQSKSGGSYDVVVEVEYRFRSLLPLLPADTIVMWAKSEMRTEY